MGPQELLTTEEAAAILRMTRDSLSRKVRRAIFLASSRETLADSEEPWTNA